MNFKKSKIIIKKRWMQFLKDAANLSKGPIKYRYPLNDNATNNNLEKQDPGKQSREQLIYTKWLDYDWKIGIDFGCGIGSNFHCFDQLRYKSNLLIGIDPDHSRVLISLKSAKKSNYIETMVICNNIEIIEKSPDDLFVDTILCSQVLGHVPKNEMGRILRGFASKLKTGGHCAISLPVVGDSFASDPTAGGWKPGDDFYHLVFNNRSPFDADYRELVTADIFDKYALNSPQDVLPVRCFWMQNFPDTSNLALPAQVIAPPKTFSAVALEYFDIKEVILYSIHGRGPKYDKPAIGDVFISLIRK